MHIQCPFGCQSIAIAVIVIPEPDLRPSPRQGQGRLTKLPTGKGTWQSTDLFARRILSNRVESRVAERSSPRRVSSRRSRCQVKSQVNNCQVNSSQVNVNAQDALELQSISGLYMYIQLIIIN